MAGWGFIPIPNALCPPSGKGISYPSAANLVAWPLAYFALHQWLRGYAIRAPLDPVIFLTAGAAALMVAGLTVSRQAVRAARRNPADSIRYE